MLSSSGLVRICPFLLILNVGSPPHMNFATFSVYNWPSPCNEHSAHLFGTSTESESLAIYVHMHISYAYIETQDCYSRTRSGSSKGNGIRVKIGLEKACVCHDRRL